jgi:H+/Cl- antiporter ClcA
MTVRIWLWVVLHRGRNYPWLHNVLLLSCLQKGGITLVCGLCLLLMFFESAVGICIGCWLRNRMRPDQAKLCPGGACEYRPDSKDRLKLGQMLVVLAFAGVMVVVATGLAGKRHTTAQTMQSTAAIDPAEAERCYVPDFAKAMGELLLTGKCGS